MSVRCSHYFICIAQKNCLEYWGFPTNETDVWKVFKKFITSAHAFALPWCEEGGLDVETKSISSSLALLNEHGYLTINSQVISIHFMDFRGGADNDISIYLYIYMYM